MELALKMTRLFVQELDRDNEDYTRRMRYVLDPDMSFYREFGLKRMDRVAPVRSRPKA